MTSQRIPSTFIQEVLARNDIVEIIRSRVNLVQRGDNHLARCPFHEEKTPSFNVSHSKQFYYCFGCSASGNAIGFLMAFDHMEFREAVAHLAAQIGLEIPTTAAGDDDDTQRHQILYQVLDSAEQYYRSHLRRHPTAVTYLKSRGVSGVTAKTFGVGYAPPGWQGLQQHIGNDPEQHAALITNGLVINKKPGQLYDSFRERIMFPIRNLQGKIIGFGGRALGDGQPKYLNSPETPLFHKGRELYGLYEARRHTAKLTQLIVVEGYMDVIALHQHGLTHAVATLGTAVTANQVQKCLRYVHHLTFCFDGDRAGRQAAWKALLITLPLLREGIHIKFLFLPDGEDPDSLVRKIGADPFLQQLEQALPLSEVFFKELKSQAPLNSPADKAQLGQQAAQHLNTMPHGLFRQLMYEQLAKELAIDADALNALLQPAAASPPPYAAATLKKPATGDRRPRTLMPQLLEEQIISLLLQHPALAVEYASERELIMNLAQEGDPPPENRHSPLLERVWEILHQHPTITTGELLLWVEGDTERQFLAKLAAQPKLLSSENAKNEFLGGLATIKQQSAQLKIQSLVEKAKKSQLNLEEKRKLQTLLATLKKDASER